MDFKISRAAKRLGIHPNTIRDLEKRGVITARRDWAGYRIFSRDDIEQIRQRIFPKVSEGNRTAQRR